MKEKGGARIEAGGRFSFVSNPDFKNWHPGPELDRFQEKEARGTKQNERKKPF